MHCPLSWVNGADPMPPLRPVSIRASPKLRWARFSVSVCGGVCLATVYKRAPGKSTEVLHDTGRVRVDRQSDGLAHLLTEADLLVPLTAY